MVGGGMGGGGGVVSCTSTCVDPQECLPTSNGGVCVDAYRVFLKAPTSGTVFNLMTSSTVVAATVTRTDGGTPPPSLTSIPLSIPGFPMPPVALLRDGGTEFDGTLNFPAVEASYTAVAGWMPSPNDSTSFRVDRVAPVLSFALPPFAPDAGAFLRDQFVPAVLRSNEPLDGSGVAVTMVGTGGVPLPQTIDATGSVCTARGLTVGMNDVCVRLDMAGPLLNAITSAFTLSGTARDLAGNPASTTASVPVTRTRWVQRLTVNGAFRAAPALDSQGNLFIGSENSFGTGSLYSFAPNGTTRAGFPVSTGAIQSLAVTQGAGGELVFAAMNLGTLTSPQAALRTYNASDGAGIISGAQSCTSSDRATWSAIALYDGGVGMGGMVPHGTIVFSQGALDPTGTFCDYAVTGAAGSVTRPGYAQPIPGGFPKSAANLVVRGAQVYFQDTSGSISYVNLGGSGPSVGGSSAVAAATSPTGLALGGSVLHGTWSRNLGTPLLVASAPNPSTLTAVTGAAWGAAAVPPVLLGNGMSSISGMAVTPNETLNATNYLLSTSTSFMTPSLGATSTGVAAPSQSATVQTSPVVGTGPRVYAVGGDATLYVFEANTTTGIANATGWSASAAFGNLLNVNAHPTLDCNRINPGRPGTLYVVASVLAGNGGVVAAIIVDSTKLDASSAWPKWQRTAGNSGNPDFALNPGCPP